MRAVYDIFKYIPGRKCDNEKHSAFPLWKGFFNNSRLQFNLIFPHVPTLFFIATLTSLTFLYLISVHLNHDEIFQSCSIMTIQKAMKPKWKSKEGGELAFFIFFSPFTIPSAICYSKKLQSQRGIFGKTSHSFDDNNPLVRQERDEIKF